MLFEPFVGQVLGDDREEVNLWLGDVVEPAKIVHAEAIPRLAETSKMLAAGLALFAGLVAKMGLLPLFTNNLTGFGDHEEREEHEGRIHQGLPSVFAFFAPFVVTLFLKVGIHGRSDAGAIAGAEPLEVVDGFGCEDGFINHSSQKVAGNARPVTSASKRQTNRWAAEKFTISGSQFCAHFTLHPGGWETIFPAVSEADRAT